MAPAPVSSESGPNSIKPMIDNPAPQVKITVLLLKKTPLPAIVPAQNGWHSLRPFKEHQNGNDGASPIEQPIGEHASGHGPHKAKKVKQGAHVACTVRLKPKLSVE